MEGTIKNMKIRLALIDDHALVLQGLQNKLEQIPQFDIVGAFTEVNDLLLCINYKDVDVIIMDLMLKGLHGFDLIQKIRGSIDKEIKIILISGFYDELLHKRALDMDVKAFLPKEASYEELVSCIINVYRGNNIIPDFLIEEKNKWLTDVEQKILKLVIEEYTNEKIAKELYISRRTVETHIANICRKLNVNSRVGIVREAIKLKLI